MSVFVRATNLDTILSEPTLSVIFLRDWLSSPSRTRPTNSRGDTEPLPLTHLTICRADFLSDCLFLLEAGGELNDGCMTSCHSALTPTSVSSLCISVTRVLWLWPAPINQLFASLPRPHSALSPLLSSPPLFLTLTPQLSSSPLPPAYPSLVLHSGSVLHLHCGCQSAGRREELETGLSLACLRPCGHEVLPKESNLVSSCILVTSRLPFCLKQIASAIFKQRMVWITPLCESSAFSTCHGSLRSYLLYCFCLQPLLVSVCFSAIFFFPPWNENELAVGSGRYDRSCMLFSILLPTTSALLFMLALSLSFSVFHRLRITAV